MTNKEPVSLEQLIPEEATVMLYNEGLKREYVLRRVSLEDQVWMNKTLGAQALESGNLEAYAKVVFRLLKEKEDFKAIEVSSFDDDGEPEEIRLKGHERVMRGIIGTAHQTDIVNAIFKVFGISNPVLNDEQQKEVEKEVKKKVTKKKKK